MKAPILVWQMGKVGSMSIHHALTKIGLDAVHVHVLNPQRLAERRMLRAQAGLPPTLQHEEAMRLQSLLADPSIEFQAISAVRDPIAQALSAVFQVWGERSLPPGVRRDDPAAIARWFAEDIEQFHSLEWFEREVEHLFGLDVYSVPFDRERRCLRLNGSRLKLLVLRCEDDNETKDAALNGFLGRQDIRLSSVNATADKPVAALYEETRCRAKLPPALVDRYLGSRLARHFYSSDEIATFRASWSA